MAGRRQPSPVFEGAQFGDVQITGSLPGKNVAAEMPDPSRHGLVEHVIDKVPFQRLILGLMARPAPERQMEKIVFGYAQHLGGLDDIAEVGRFRGKIAFMVSPRVYDTPSLNLIIMPIPAESNLYRRKAGIVEGGAFGHHRFCSLFPDRGIFNSCKNKGIQRLVR